MRERCGFNLDRFKRVSHSISQERVNQNLRPLKKYVSLMILKAVEIWRGAILTDGEPRWFFFWDNEWRCFQDLLLWLTPELRDALYAAGELLRSELLA